MEKIMGSFVLKVYFSSVVLIEYFDESITFRLFCLLVTVACQIRYNQN